MKVFRHRSEVPPSFGPSVVAVGKFDGVHVGHRAIIERLVGVARETNRESVVVTFDRNPLAILAPDHCPVDVMPLHRRLELFEEAGVSAVLVLPFTAEFAAEPPDVFISEVLVDALDARVVLAGENFRFGHRGAGDLVLLADRGRRAGFEVEPIAAVHVGGAPVSSTRVREALAEGRVDLAATLLGRPAEVTGLVVRGLQRGRELGFPTANLGNGFVDGKPVPVEGFVPADGVYAGWLVVTSFGDVENRGGGVDVGVRFPAAISVGTNPTFVGVPRTVEAYVLDKSFDLYGLIVAIHFVEFVRPMVAFDGIASLIDGITGDVRRVRHLLT